MKYFLTFILLFTTTLYAQEPAHYVVGKDIFDGVHLYSIIQDDTNNSIWLTSNKGIYHYDGVKFTHQLPNISKNTSFFNLVKDINGVIYCHNLNGQVFKLVDKQFELYYEIPKPYSSNITTIQFNSNNDLLINCDASVLLFINQKKAIINMYKGVAYLTKSDSTIYYSRTIASKEYIVKRTNNNEQTTAIKNGVHLFIVDGNIYGKQLQTNFLKLKGDRFVEITLPFEKDSPFHISKSRHHIWFGSFKKGVYCIANNKIDKNIKPKKWFKNTFVSGAFTDNENNTWLLTFDKGIIIIPNLENTITTAPNGYDFQGISKTDNKLYISTQNGQIFSLKNKKFTPYFKVDNDDRVEFIKVYPKQKIVITNQKKYFNNYTEKSSFCRDATLVKDSLFLALSFGLFKKNIKSRSSIEEEKLSTGRVYNIYYDTLTQKTWFSTTNGLKYHKNKIITSITNNEKEIIEAKIEPVNGQIWVGSKDGILIFENDTISKHLTQKNGLLSKDVDNIKFEYPNVYLAYQKGMQRYNINTEHFTNFTFADGLTKRTTQFEVLNDTIYAINSDGLLTFTFNKENTKQNNYKTQITKALANGNNPIKNNTELSADTKNLHFSFLTPTFKHQKEIRYEYQLIGLDKKSIPATENQFSVNYVNVPAGKYVFKVDSFLGNIQNESATLKFTIKEIWYKTLWFRLLCIALLLYILYYIYKTRVNNILRKRDKEELQKRLAESSLVSLKAQMNPHFMFNAINSIQSLVLHKKQIEAYKYLTQLADLIRNNLQMSNVSFVTLQEELTLIKQYLELEKLRFEDSFTYNIVNTIKDINVTIPSMIIQPFIENAIKHGLLHREGNKRLFVHFSKDKNIVVCTIVDNGIGRDASRKMYQKRKYKSFSTRAIEKRFNILKEYYTLDIGYEYEDLYSNNIPSGTKVIIKIIVKNEYK